MKRILKETFIIANHPKRMVMMANRVSRERKRHNRHEGEVGFQFKTAMGRYVDGSNQFNSYVADPEAFREYHVVKNNDTNFYNYAKAVHDVQHKEMSAEFQRPEHKTTKDKIVYHGVSHEQSIANLLINAKNSNGNRHFEHELKGYTSTSSSPIKAEGFSVPRTSKVDSPYKHGNHILAIHVPTGSHIVDVHANTRGEAHHAEREILIHHGAKLKIRSKPTIFKTPYHQTVHIWHAHMIDDGVPKE